MMNHLLRNVITFTTKWHDSLIDSFILNLLEQNSIRHVNQPGLRFRPFLISIFSHSLLITHYSSWSHVCSTPFRDWQFKLMLPILSHFPLESIYRVSGYYCAKVPYVNSASGYNDPHARSHAPDPYAKRDEPNGSGSSRDAYGSSACERAQRLFKIDLGK